MHFRGLVVALALALGCGPTADQPTAPPLLAKAPSRKPVTQALATLNTRPFNTKAATSNDTQGSEGWNTTEYSSPNMTIVSDATAPSSAPSVAQVRYPAGMAGNGNAHRAVYGFDGQARTVRGDVWVKVSANFQGPTKLAAQVVTFNIGGSRRVAFEISGIGSGALRPRVSLWSAPDARDSLVPNLVPSVSITRGQWHKWTVFTRISNKGVADGIISLYIDDVPVLRYSDVGIVASNKTDYFNQFDWKSNWGGSGDAVVADMHMWWDHATIEASSARESEPTPPPPPAPVASVVIAPDSAAAQVGGTQQYTATAYDSVGNLLSRPITFASSDAGVATVNASGLATGVSVGSALVIASAEGKADTARFVVESAPPVVTTVTVSPEAATKFVGESQQFTASALDQYGQPISATFAWTSTSGAATVNASGLATGVSAGVASIIVAADGKADTATFTVQNPPPVVTTVTVTPATASIPVGSTQQFSVAVLDQYGQPISATVAWSSTATGVATVNSGGLASGIAAGSAAIIASAGGKADTSALTVTAAPPGNAHYVAVGGAASGPGTFAQPWGLQYAVSGAGGQLSAGDTVYIRAGTYDTTAVVGWRLTVNGTTSGHIVFSGAPSEATPVIKKQFRVTGDYVTVRKLKFEGPIDGTTNQVWLTTVHHVLFTENEITAANANAGLSVDNAADVTISHNYIHHNGNQGTFIDHGIYFKTTDGPGNLITNNVITHNAGRGISLHDNTYDGSNNGVFDVVVTHNTIVANGSTGLLLNDGDRNTVANNILMGNGDGSGQAQLRVQDGSQQVVRYNVTWHPTATSRRGIDNSGSSTSVMGPNLIADPLFVSAYSDLRLQSGSPAISYRDSAYQQLLDYGFFVRDAAPDAGALEYRP